MPSHTHILRHIQHLFYACMYLYVLACMYTLYIRTTYYVYYYDDGHHFYIPEILQNKVPPTEALRWVVWTMDTVGRRWSEIGVCKQIVAYYTWYLDTYT